MHLKILYIVCGEVSVALWDKDYYHPCTTKYYLVCLLVKSEQVDRHTESDACEPIMQSA